MKQFGFTTKILHSDRWGAAGKLGKPEHGSLHKPVHHAVAYGYEDSHDLAAVFQGTKGGYAYGRQSNPTVEALEHKVTQMEQGVGSICFATGMAAVGALGLALLKHGDHVIASAYLFGNTNSLFNTLKAIGVEVDFVDATHVSHVKSALRPSTRMVFVETIANPVTQIADLEGIGAFCKEHRLLYVIDNTMTSPVLFLPKNVQATFSMNSLTKYIGGHGNALGGSVTDLGCFDWNHYPHLYDIYKTGDSSQWGLNQVRKKGLRDFGAALSPEAAHMISAGSDTIELRMERNCQNALALAEFLQSHPKVEKVNYPGLKSHPQYDRAQKIFKRFGALFSFELKQGVDCFKVLNELKLVVSSSNLGDNRTLGIPVAHTIYFEMGAQRRAEMGIADSLLRISVGIEDTADLLKDFKQALELA